TPSVRGLGHWRGFWRQRDKAAISADRRHKADMHDTIIIIRQTRMATVCDATVKAGYKERRGSRALILTRSQDPYYATAAMLLRQRLDNG
ncbi:uncharacterized protein Dere_GG26494, partial [Drosophila erecta]